MIFLNNNNFVNTNDNFETLDTATIQCIHSLISISDYSSDDVSSLPVAFVRFPPSNIWKQHFDISDVLLEEVLKESIFSAAA